MRKFLSADDPVIRMHLPRVLIETAVLQGADEDALLRAANIDRAMVDSPDARVSHLEVGRLARRAIELTGNPGLGLDVGRRLTLSNLGMLGLAVTSSPDTRAALETGIRYSKAVVPAWDLGLEIGPKRSRITVTPILPLGRLVTFSTENLIAGVLSLAHAVIDEDDLDVNLHVTYPRPPHAHRYESELGVRTEFDSEATSADFDSAYLDRPLASPDPVSAKLAARYCAAEIASQPFEGSLVERVQHLLSKRPGEYPTEEAIARGLQTSTRTLRRELRRFATSFQQLKDEARRDHALELIQSTGFSVDQIARILGFSDSRSFRRAYKRWTGQTPSQIRNPSP